MALVAGCAIVAFAGRAAMKADLAETEARAARDLAEAKTTESELERGRAALLHGEPEAQCHLAEAYKRDPAPTTAFMLARAMQPRLNELARLPGTYGRTWWATFSPDGSQIATADDRAAQVWDGKTYRLLFTLPHGVEVYQVAYMPDASRLVTVTAASVRIWDARSGTLVSVLGAKPGDPKSPDYFAIAISPDGSLVAAADAAGSIVHVWDVTSGAVTPDGLVVAGDADGLLRFWDAETATSSGRSRCTRPPHPPGLSQQHPARGQRISSTSPRHRSLTDPVQNRRSNYRYLANRGHRASGIGFGCR